MFRGDFNDHIPLTIVEDMIHQFFMAIPNVDKILDQVPEKALFRLVSKHVQIKMSTMFGAPHERISDSISREQFIASFGDLFAGANHFTTKTVIENPFQETSMNGLAELDRQLMSISSIMIAQLLTDSISAVAKRVLRKDPGIRLIHELRWLITLMEPGLDRLDISYHNRIEIARYLQPQIVEAGETLFTEGQQDFCALLDGDLNVMRMNGLGVLATVSDLSSGATFGEINLMLWDRRPTPVVARRQSIIGILDYPWFRHLIYPTLHAVHRSKHVYFRKIPYLSGINAQALSEIAYMAKIKHFRSQQIIFQQGQVMPPSVLFVKVGRVRIVREIPPADRVQRRRSGSSSTWSSARSSRSCSSSLYRAQPTKNSSPKMPIRPFSSKIVREGAQQTARPKTATCRFSSRFGPDSTRPKVAPNQQCNFLECCIVEHMTALGEIMDERAKIQYKWRISAIALDRVTAYEIPNHLLLPYASIISPNLYRCSPDIKLIRYQRVTEAWDLYRSRREGPGENGFFSGRHIYRVVREASKPLNAPDLIGDVMHLRKTTGLIGTLDIPLQLAIEDIKF